ncbi:porin [Epibacterium sp. SM1969]|uniref:Porin n=1 Tax=Tritonibacter aquimaris TaxID=2663379 RepID=A0A844ARL1_9RHOB|nr:porin [Tritonibacter aquimaris]MQY41788.1 porin [Tritonibacter aquimaris]
MKKILFATTALIATAGVAAADVSFGGYGRFGLFYDEGNEAKETRLEQRFRLNITATAESDAGVEFGGRIRLQSDEKSTGGAAGSGPGAAGFWVSTGGFRLDLGNTSDVLDSGDIVSFYGNGVGLTAFVEQSDAFGGDANGFGSGNPDRQTVKARYTVGDFTAAVSFTEESEDAAVDLEDHWSYYQIGFAYDFGVVSAGIVYGDRDSDRAAFDLLEDTSYWIIGVSGELGQLSYNLTVGEDDLVDEVAYGLSVAYDVSSATTLTAVVADSGVDSLDEVYGVGFKHSLGGGVSLRGGVGQETDGDTLADLGIRFDF